MFAGAAVVDVRPVLAGTGAGRFSFRRRPRRLAPPPAKLTVQHRVRRDPRICGRHGASRSAPPLAGRRRSRVLFLLFNPGRYRRALVVRLAPDQSPRRSSPHSVPPVDRALGNVEFFRELRRGDVIMESGGRGGRCRRLLVLCVFHPEALVNVSEWQVSSEKEEQVYPRHLPCRNQGVGILRPGSRRRRLRGHDGVGQIEDVITRGSP